jgi:3-hydroxyisobutyrate dehydrogenase
MDARTVAFLGTGTMGAPMARRLLDAGFSVRAWNRTAERAQPLAEHGAEVLGEPEEAVRGAGLVVTMLSDAATVLDTAAAALPAAGGETIWIQCSTIGIQGAERCGELAERFAVRFVDAPVLGTREPAQRGELVVLASGPGDAEQACRPVFEAIGQRTLWLGEAGAGTRCKLMVNSWVLGVVGVLAETIALGESLGIDPERFFDAVAGGALDLPYARLKGRAMIERAFSDPAFRLALARKDAELVLAAADGAGLEAPVLAAVAARLHRAERAGHGEEDFAATFLATPLPGDGAARPRAGSRAH